MDASETLIKKALYVTFDLSYKSAESEAFIDCIIRLIHAGNMVSSKELYDYSSEFRDFWFFVYESIDNVQCTHITVCSVWKAVL